MQHPGDHFLAALLAGGTQGADCPYAAAVAPGEDPAWLEALHARLLDEQAPADSIEAHLVWRMTLAIWRAERAIRAEAAASHADWPIAAARAAQIQQDRALLELERATMFLIERRRRQRAEEIAAAADRDQPDGNFLDLRQIRRMLDRAGGPANRGADRQAGAREGQHARGGRPAPPPDHR